MNIFFKSPWVLLILVFNLVNAQTIEVSNNTPVVNLLKHSAIFLDDKNVTMGELLHKPNYFKPYSKNLINIGGDKKKVWIKFSLHNASDKKLKKILLFTDPSLEYISLFNEQGRLIEEKGIAHYDSEHKTLLYYIPIELDANETKRYYLQIYNDYLPLGFSLELMDEKYYINRDKKEQLLNLFLMGMIAAFVLYSIVMGYYMKESSYFYYALYLGTLLYMTLGYLGFISVFFPEQFIEFNYRFSIVRVYIITITTALFAMSFLKIKHHKPYYYIYLLLIAVTVLMMLFFNGTDEYSVKIGILMAIIVIIYNFFVGIVVYRKGYKEARFYIVGFGLVLLSYLIMLSDALGWSYLTHNNYNLILWTTLLEALALSLAFADRYIAIQNKLMHEITHKQKEIQKEVKEKTSQLKTALETKDLLLQEVHHRVKNNLHIILSMVQLQHKNVSHTHNKEVLQSLENRINAVAKTYDMLIVHDDLHYIDMKVYIAQLLRDIQNSFSYLDMSVTLETDIEATLPLKEAVYIGLIINEALVNSYKYAFSNNQGHISIILHQDGERYRLVIADSGNGFVLDKKRKSLGIKLIYTLVEEQLKGEIKLLTKHKTEYNITFKL